MTAPPTAEATTVQQGDHMTYDNGYQEQREEITSGSGYIPQPSLPATQEPLAPPSPVVPQHQIE